MANTSIEWTNKVWNPVTGCSKVSAGCKNCYAETIANRFWGDRKFTNVQLHPERLEQPLHWKKPTRIFVNSMSDLFHENVPIDFIDRVFNVMRRSNQHIYQVLTKRPDRMLQYFYSHHSYDLDYFLMHLPKNIWLGVSVEDQKTADERIPILLQTPAAVRWISAEPLLGSINLKHWLYRPLRIGHKKNNEILHWVVVGTESGPKTRKYNTTWILDIIHQCKAANVPIFVKQLTSHNGRKIPFNTLSPEFQIREYPKVKQ